MIGHIKAYFRRQQSAGAFPGGQLVVRRNGEPIASEAIGTARGFGGQETERPMPVGSQTLFPVYSCGKPLAAAAIAMLEDRGKLDPNAPVAEVFPEFARNGKAQITVLDVLTHRSGIVLPHLHVPSRMDCWNDREKISKELENAVPRYPRGTLAYGPYEFGWILSEMVRRVDGRDLVDYFADEIAAPLGLPELSFKLDGRNPNSIGRSYWLG